MCRGYDQSLFLTIDSTSSGIMEAASYLLTNHSLVAKAIERDEYIISQISFIYAK